MAVALTANAQERPYLRTPGANRLEIVKSPAANVISFNADRPADTKNLYSLWLETGDGNYVSSFSAGLTDIPAGPYINQPFLFASKLYEGRRPPNPTNRSTLNVTTASTPVTMMSPALGTGRLKLFSNVRDIVSGDTMVFGISYLTDTIIAKDKINKYKLVFRYNKDQQNTFIPFLTATDDFPVADYNNNTSLRMPGIRKYGSETVSLLTAGDINLGTYQKGIVFKDINPDGKLFNIFISLVPNEVLNNTNNIEVELLYQTPGSENWKSAGTDNLSMLSGYSHDPNNIDVFPQCLSLPQTKQILHYTINFQNTGTVNANSVKVAYYIPGQMNINRGIFNLKVSFGEEQNYTRTVTINDWANGRIIFNMDGILEGCHSPNTVTSLKTMGKITFDVEILPGANPQMPALLQAWADIYLKGNIVSRSSITSEMESEGLYIDGTAGYEMPVRTQNAITQFSNCCSYVPDCNCKHPKGFWQWLQCYWWILVIVLLLFVIWWLYKIRHH